MILSPNVAFALSRILSTIVVVAAFIAPLAWPTIGAADMARPSFFNSREIRSADISRFKKWNAALARYAAEREREQAGGTDQWHAFLDSIRDADKGQQLSAVNGFMNTRRYVTDDSNWGINDYWASPSEFLSRSAGDCEDYAIAKYLSLKLLGWTDDELRIVAVKDLKLGIGHAVLVAFRNGRTLVLDNQSELIKDADQLPHYQPVYSINATSWWLHRKDSRV